MAPRIAIVGTGAVGGYAGAYMAKAKHDVTFIDMWPENVQAMRNKGLTITHLRDVPEFTVPVKAIHITDVQEFSREAPIDIAFVCVKSYDTAWATTMIQQYLAPGGFIVSLQNCINEPVISGIVGAEKTVGSIASSITVELIGPGHVKRAAGKSGASHTVFRVGEIDGKITPRIEQVRDLLALTDSAMVAPNLKGERWSKLILNVMGNGLSACTGLITRDMFADDVLRGFMARLGSEAVRVGQALGLQLGDVYHMPAEIIALAGENDPEGKRIYDKNRLDAIAGGTGGEHRPSMGQDMVKGRRTEIEFMNGLIVAEGKKVGIATPANAALTDIVKRVERRELQPDKRHITSLKLS